MTNTDGNLGPGMRQVLIYNRVKQNGSCPSVKQNNVL